MKLILNIAWVTLIVFVGITLLTAQIKQPVDGDNRYGFPFRFFIEHSLMCNPCPENPADFNLLKLSADILFAILLSTFLWVGIGKLARRYFSHTEN